MAFISERLQAYKAGKDGVFFKRLIADVGAAPEEILHIGDGRSDIIGAKRAGIPMCLVDRKSTVIPEGLEYAPDFTVKNLGELTAILDA
jgi:FMN phosphatase YigB (HAD superfamily)